jgi:molybdopterin synthase sulfur carrier subunit
MIKPQSQNIASLSLSWRLEFGVSLELGVWLLGFPNFVMIRVVLPHHLRTLARVGDEVQLDVDGHATIRAILDSLEIKYPMLRGTIRDHVTFKRRPFVRFFACEEDLSHEPADALLPEAIATGAEPFFVMGAIAGG